MVWREKPIRFGVNFLPNHALELLNWVNVAEESGFDIAGIADSQSLYRDVYVCQAWWPPTRVGSASARGSLTR